MKWRNIVIAGDVGTGTTTLAENLAKKLGWQYESSGDFFRQYTKENNIPLWNTEAIPDELDKKIDSGLVDKVKNESGWVLDTHYGGWFTKDSDDTFRILLTCDRKVATERMLKRRHTHDETAEEIEKRRKGLYDKFKRLYSEDNYEDPKLFHLVIDTTTSTPLETLTAAMEKLN